jgi:hypothetical protein
MADVITYYTLCVTLANNITAMLCKDSLEISVQFARIENIA